MSKLFYSILIFLIIFTPTVLGLGLSGEILSPIIYEPGKKIVNHYQISDTVLPVEVYLSGDLLEYMSTTPVIDKQFDLIIEFPETYPEAGTYEFSLTVQELSDGPTPQIGSLLSVIKMFRIEVYTQEKNIGVSLSTPSVNVGQNLPITVDVQSRTYQDIQSIRSEIELFNSSEQSFAKLNTDQKSLPALSTATLTANYDTGSLNPGQYQAQAIVYYDGQTKTAESTFRLGHLDLILRNYSSVLPQGFSEFTVTVFNNWGEQLNNVYAKLYLNEQELLQTPSQNLGPWQEQILKGLVKVELEPGLYEGRLELFFAEQSKIVPVEITVVTPAVIETPSSYPGAVATVLAITAVLLVILLAYLFLKHDRSKNQKKDEEL